jgi:hypothetical protein
MLTRNDLTTIHAIADRAAALFVDLGVATQANAKFVKTITAAELAIVHGDIVELRLTDLLAADDANFAHDIGGIHRHLSLGQTKLKDCFLPRFAKV